MSVSKVLVLLLACVSLLQALPFNYNTNHAYLQPVYVSCGYESCSHTDYPSDLITDGLNDTYWRSNADVSTEYELTIQLAQVHQQTDRQTNRQTNLLNL